MALYIDWLDQEQVIETDMQSSAKSQGRGARLPTNQRGKRGLVEEGNPIG